MKQLIVLAVILCSVVGVTAQQALETKLSNRLNSNQIVLDSTYTYDEGEIVRKTIMEYSDNVFYENIYNWNSTSNSWEFYIKTKTEVIETVQNEKKTVKQIYSHAGIDLIFTNQRQKVITYPNQTSDLEESVIEYFWNSTTNQWDNYNQDNYTYNEQGQVLTDSVLYFDDDSNKWLIYFKYEAIYDLEGKKIEEHVSKWEDNSYWNKVTKITHEYNDTHSKPIKSIHYEGNNLNMIKEITGTYLGDTLIYVTKSDVDGVWATTQQETYLYNFSYSFKDIQHSLGYIPQAGELHDIYQFQLLSFKREKFDGNKWLDPYQVDFFYESFITNKIEQNNQTLEIYPNPAQNYIQTCGGDFKLYNQVGKKILESSSQLITVQNLENGMYIYHLKKNNQLKVGKLVIQK